MASYFNRRTVVGLQYKLNPSTPEIVFHRPFNENFWLTPENHSAAWEGIAKFHGKFPLTKNKMKS